jgi:rubrerythrin
MAIIYNAEEIYQMGVEIEKNGLAFYAAAAQSVKNADVKKLCEELGQWEGKHVALFEALKAKLPEAARQETSYDPNNELGMYLKAAADSHIFVANKEITALVANAKSPLDILHMALSFEKDSVVLYTTMKNMVPEHLGKKDLEKIIDEEIMHISFITRKIATIPK